jgi:hypothetical protein
VTTNPYWRVEAVAGGYALGLVLASPKSVLVIDATEFFALVANGTPGTDRHGFSFTILTDIGSFEQRGEEEIAQAFTARFRHPFQVLDNNELALQ